MDYGWNAINMKRVAHGFMNNVVIENFTNALYIQDSRNLSIENVKICGNDGHQGIKLYGHSADNLFRNILFENHYADMMGGEGNCYGNVFTNISYANSENKYVDFDFHGFSEGPFSPPSYTLFDNIHGFSGIKGGGALYNQPACASFNVWWNINSDGYDGTPYLFINECYNKKNKVEIFLSSLKHVIVSCIRKKRISIDLIKKEYRYNKKNKQKLSKDRETHYQFFKSSVLSGYFSDYYNVKAGTITDNGNYIYTENMNDGYSLPLSLYGEQLQRRINKDIR
jgi:hypothetical protein